LNDKIKVCLPPVCALDTVAVIGLANDDDVGLSVTTGVVTTGSGGSDGDEGGDQKLLKMNSFINIKIF